MANSSINTKLDELLLRGQTEVADIDLYAPIPPKEDCPICLLPLPIEPNESCYMTCCGTVLCFGCIHSSKMNGLKDLCAFCRQPFARNAGIDSARLKKRMEHDDPESFNMMAHRYWMGGSGVEVNVRKALDLFIRAAELGMAEAYYNVACKGFVTGWKARACLEVSAKKGLYKAHEHLGEIEETSGNINTAIKHWTVAANAGSQSSLNMLIKAFKNNQLSKEELAQVLRAFQASSDETKSQARDDFRRAKVDGRVSRRQ